jgi:hypothetical protein
MIGDSFHDSKCGVQVYNTDNLDIYLADGKQSMNIVHRINYANVDLAVHFNTQLRFLAPKLKTVLKRAYHKTIDPACLTINANTLEQMQKVNKNTFSRNLGDLSVVFECVPVIVAPTINQSYCYTRLPVQDLKSNLYYLDSFTYILKSTAAIALCLHASTPIYRTTDGVMVTYTPNRDVVIMETCNISNKSQTGGKKGIYYLSARDYQKVARNIVYSAQLETLI